MYTKIGCNVNDNHAAFTVWAPCAKNVVLSLHTPRSEQIPMKRTDFGYWTAHVDACSPQTRYTYIVDNEKNRPDPASMFQPDGPHQSSQIVSHNLFQWQDTKWRGIPLEKIIVYELHVGTFTREGTFDAVIEKLGYLNDLGITAIELMPVAQFPGTRNWGYDGTYPFAVQNSYGGPDGLKRLVSACHKMNISVILDVVYNHLGPEGNYLRGFAPYFTNKYTTPWGEAINYDGEYSYGVRNFVIQNALYWFRHFHIDALRLDAVHGIFDMSAKHILRELAEATADFSTKTGRKRYLIAESDLNDSRLIRSADEGGYAIDAQWSDDFHHSVHALVTGETTGYYEDFGSAEDLLVVLKKGFRYAWDYSSFRKRYHGNDASDLDCSKFVVSVQNHDQVGNRLMGDRFSTLLSFESIKLAAGVLLLSPYVPMLFMGEEFAAKNPFLYFVSHSDKQLIDAVRSGRREEFSSFEWSEEPPDPQAAETFQKSIIPWDILVEGEHKTLLKFYKTMITIRKKYLQHSVVKRNDYAVTMTEPSVLCIDYTELKNRLRLYLNFSCDDVLLNLPEKIAPDQILINSADKQWGGSAELSSKQVKGEKLTVNATSMIVIDIKE